MPARNAAKSRELNAQVAARRGRIATAALRAVLRSSKRSADFVVQLAAGADEAKGGLPTVARSTRRKVHLRFAQNPGQATVDNLRLNHERRLVDQTGIEPVTSSMPLMRAPNCATGPLREEIYSIVPTVPWFNPVKSGPGDARRTPRETISLDEQPEGGLIASARRNGSRHDQPRRRAVVARYRG